MYKIKFFISVFLVFLLFSYYIYAENNRNKSEEVAHQILGHIDEKEQEDEKVDTTIKNVVNDVIIVELDEEEADNQTQLISNENILNNNENNRENNSENNNQEKNDNRYVLNDGNEAIVEARLTISKLGIDYPVFSETSEELLKSSLNKYWGNGPNKVGNYCIVGHNYANGKMFGKLSQIKIGDTACLEDMETGRKITYEVYKMDIVDPNDVSCTSQLTDGRREMTLITCKNYGTQRLIVKCREV